VRLAQQAIVLALFAQCIIPALADDALEKCVGALKPGVSDSQTIEQGIEACTAVIRRGSGNPAALLAGRAELYAKNGRIVEALDDYSSAVEHDPGNYLYYQYRGIFYAQKMQELDKALLDFEEVVKLKPASAEGYYNRGLARNMLGQMEEAESDFQKVLEIDPSHEGASQMLR
jgi:tetratricopeptide (TPR) repeat protein